MYSFESIFAWNIFWIYYSSSISECSVFFFLQGILGTPTNNNMMAPHFSGLGGFDSSNNFMNMPASMTQSSTGTYPNIQHQNKLHKQIHKNNILKIVKRMFDVAVKCFLCFFFNDKSPSNRTAESKRFEYDKKKTERDRQRQVLINNKKQTF